MTTPIDPVAYARTAEAVEAEIAKVIVGQRALVRTVLLSLLSEGHVLLEGVPGLGKTMLLKTLGEAVALDFGRVQFTPDLMPADILGTQVLEPDADGARRFAFQAGPVFTNLLLADEINRATPKTQSAMLEAMQERSVTTAGTTRPLPRPFLVLATQNPLEMEGTYPLPEAQLDRFQLKAQVGFPSAEELVEVALRTTGEAPATVSAAADAETLRAMIALTREVPVAHHLLRHAVDLVLATHPDGEGAPDPVRRYVRFGSSPRGVQAMVLASKALALLEGRPSVSAEDVRSVAPAALRHRMVLGYEATADGVDAEQLVDAVLDAVPRPTAEVRGAPT